MRRQAFVYPTKINEMTMKSTETVLPGYGVENAGSNKEDAIIYDMIVFCHLRWGFVYQRPQHLITRLAKSKKILLIEEPIPYGENEYATANFIEAEPNITIMQSRVNHIHEIAQVIEKYIPNKQVKVGWFYSPAFSSLISSFKFEKVVYDCMDELSLFKGASAELVAQEKFLMSKADIVFTGGKSLYESKMHHHKNVHCFASSVERPHFEKALNGIPIPEDIAGLKKPVIGYYGVIDERINLGLIADVADKNPTSSFVMIGPLAKIREEDLPKRSNIHYIGMRGYNVLPNYLKGFDIAMMPFALNESTRFISPTKTLEYMAAGKPIISTPIKDVLRDYGHCVAIVDTADEFSEAIGDITTYGSEEQISQFETILDNTSWDTTAAKMEELLNN